MATPTYPSRRFFACGVTQGAAWGTALPVGALDELVVTSDGNPALKQNYSSSDAINRVMPIDGDLGAFEAIDFSPEFAGKIGLQYEMGAMGGPIAALFGTAPAPADLTGAYKHTWQWADEVTDFFTFVTERPNDIWEIPSCVPMKLSLKVGDGKLQGSITLRGNMLTNASVVNTATEVDAMTAADDANFVKFQHGACRMNAQGGAGLGAGDNLIISDLQLDFERLMDAQISMGATYLSQPKEQSWKITVKIKLPYVTAANTYHDIFTTMAAQKMSLVFTGGIIGATAIPYEVAFYFPRLKLTSPPDIKLEDIITGGLEFVAEEAITSLPTGMLYYRPYMTVTNLLNAQYVT
ncbi:MAG TPA: phage tail tube protein [Phycisphaerae bacterium]|nr:phage tail tube protein [Phycisphaerae bacterium]